MTIYTKATRDTIIFRTRKKVLPKAKGKAIKIEDLIRMTSYILFQYLKMLWVNYFLSIFQAYYNNTAVIILKWKNCLNWVTDNKTQLPYNQLPLWVLPVWILFLMPRFPYWCSISYTSILFPLASINTY